MEISSPCNMRLTCGTNMNQRLRFNNILNFNFNFKKTTKTVHKYPGDETVAVTPYLVRSCSLVATHVTISGGDLTISDGVSLPSSSPHTPMSSFQLPNTTAPILRRRWKQIFTCRPPLRWLLRRPLPRSRRYCHSYPQTRRTTTVTTQIATPLYHCQQISIDHRRQIDQLQCFLVDVDSL